MLSARCRNDTLRQHCAWLRFQSSIARRPTKIIQRIHRLQAGDLEHHCDFTFSEVEILRSYHCEFCFEHYGYNTAYPFFKNQDEVDQHILGTSQTVPSCGFVSANQKAEYLRQKQEFARLKREIERLDVDAWFVSWLYDAPNGQGKTLLAVQDTINWLANPNPYTGHQIIVITNVETYPEKIIAYSGSNETILRCAQILKEHPERLQVWESHRFTCSNISELAESNSDFDFLVILDEAVLKTDSRMSLTSEAIEWSHMCDIKRHLRCKLIFLSPNSNNIDVRFRESANYKMRFAKRKRPDRSFEFVYGAIEMQMGEPVKQYRPLRYSYSKAEEFFEFYNFRSLKNIQEHSEDEPDEGSSEDEIFHCETCNLDRKGKSAWDSHLASNDHQKKLRSKVKCPFGCGLEDYEHNILTHVQAKHTPQEQPTEGDCVIGAPPAPKQSDRVFSIISSLARPVPFSEIRDLYATANSKPISDTSLDRALKKLLSEGKIRKTDEGYTLA